MNTRIKLGTLGLSCFLAVAMTHTAAAQTKLAPPDELEASVGTNAEVLARGTLHEAFATPTTFDPVELPIIKQRPPEAIEELPPDHRPSGDSVIWIPGYWQFEDERDDFIWISGVWRDVPPGRQWVPGYWSEVADGFRWIPGAWVEANAQVTYRPKPPRTQERGPSARRPSDDHFYAPGNWVYHDNRYKWQPGHWAPCQQDWVWVPARYTPARNGYVYSPGYWDFPIDRRGQIFAPVYFRDRTRLGTDFRFTPAAVINTSTQLMLHLFVRPSTSSYVFGDYYSEADVAAGIRPWYAYHRLDTGYDPLFVFYDWTEGPEYATNLESWHKYFVSHPEYRPRHTLTEQLAFATENPDFKYIEQAVLGNTLNQVVNSASGANQFVRLTADQTENILGITNQIRGLTTERLQLESQVAGTVDATTQTAVDLPTQALQLPKLPGIRVPVVGRDVPDLPLNLRNVAPQVLPSRGRSPVRLPVELPKLPF